MISRPAALFATLALGLAPALVAQAVKDCLRSSTGLTPLDELSGGAYRGVPGGLYAGTNEIPAAHLAAGLGEAAAVAPRAADGTVDPNGRVVLLSIGMSNTTQEFTAWLPWSALDPERSPHLTIVDGAQGGQDARIFADPNAAAWSVVAQRLQNAGVTAAQVQAVWIKQAMAAPSTTVWPAHVDEFRFFLGEVARNVRTKFPNCRIGFLSSRCYGGYSPQPNRTEPLSYETAFGVRDLILDQIGGDPALNFDPARGAVTAPWLAWGPYFWADGVRARLDGLSWLCADFNSDGVHPNVAGRLKVADRLDRHFRTHPVAVPWYLGGNAPASAATLSFGSPCGGTNGLPSIRSNDRPVVGFAGHLIGLSAARSQAAAVLFLALGRTRIPLVGDECSLWIDPAVLIDARATSTDGSGRATSPVPIPNLPALIGGALYSQWAVDDPLGAVIPGVGSFALSSGMLSRVGVR